MHEKWYSDNRDLVKWAVLVHVSESTCIKSILQVTFHRPRKMEWQLVTKGDERVPFSGHVLSHFRDLNQIQGLAKIADLHIEVFNQQFPAEGHPSRKIAGERYVADILRALESIRRDQVILFLDPDTGIAPKNGSWSHVLECELTELFTKLRHGDCLVVYQHAQRDKNWINENRKKLAQSIRVREASVQVFRCPELASDVAFYVVMAKQK